MQVAYDSDLSDFARPQLLGSYRKQLFTYALNVRGLYGEVERYCALCRSGLQTWCREAEEGTNSSCLAARNETVTYPSIDAFMAVWGQKIIGEGSAYKASTGCFRPV